MKIDLLKKSLFLSSTYVFFVGSFLAIRIPLWLLFPAADRKPDTGSYLKIVDQWSSGFWADFSVRTPGYPLFMKCALGIWENKASIVVGHGLCYLIAGLLAIHVAFKWSKWFALTIAISLSIFQLEGIFLLQEFMLYSDSLSTSVLIVFCSMLALSYKTHRVRDFFIASLFAAFLILIRQANFYLLVLWLFVAFFQWKKQFSAKQISFCFSPIIATFIFFYGYNYVSFGEVTLSRISPFNRLFSTHTFIYENERNPDNINEMIRKSRAEISSDHDNILKGSWDFEKLRGIYHYYTDRCIYPYFKDPYENADHFKRIVRQGIVDHPLDYFKFCVTMFYAYHIMNPQLDIPFDRVSHFYRCHESHRQGEKDKNLKMAFSPKQMFEESGDKTLLTRALDMIEVCQKKWVKELYAPYMSILVLLLSLIIFYRSKWTDPLSGLIFVTYFGCFLASVLISITIVPFLRYSYPYEWLHLIAPFCSLVLFLKLFPILSSRFESQLRKTETIVMSSPIFLMAIYVVVLYSFDDHQIEKLKQPIPQDRHDNLIRLGHGFLEKSDFIMSENCFRNALQIVKSHHSHYGLALIYLKKEKAERSLYHLKIAKEHEPKFFQTYMLMAQIYLKKGDQKSLIKTFQEVKKIRPEFHPQQVIQMNPQQVKAWDKVLGS